jgi:hypothetical protein
VYIMTSDRHSARPDIRKRIRHCRECGIVWISVILTPLSGIGRRSLIQAEKIRSTALNYDLINRKNSTLIELETCTVNVLC